MGVVRARGAHLSLSVCVSIREEGGEEGGRGVLVCWYGEGRSYAVALARRRPPQESLGDRKQGGTQAPAHIARRREGRKETEVRHIYGGTPIEAEHCTGLLGGGLPAASARPGISATHLLLPTLLLLLLLLLRLLLLRGVC